MTDEPPVPSLPNYRGIPLMSDPKQQKPLSRLLKRMMHPRVSTGHRKMRAKKGYKDKFY